YGPYSYSQIPAWMTSRIREAGAARAAQRATNLTVAHRNAAVPGRTAGTDGGGSPVMGTRSGISPRTSSQLGSFAVARAPRWFSPNDCPPSGAPFGTRG